MKVDPGKVVYGTVKSMEEIDREDKARADRLDARWDAAANRAKNEMKAAEAEHVAYFNKIMKGADDLQPPAKQFGQG